MYIQVTDYKLKDVTGEEYERTCNQLAWGFTKMKGLIKMYWTKNTNKNIYGAIYVWEDKSCMESFVQSVLHETIFTHPNFKDFRSSDYEVVEFPTELMQGDIIEENLKVHEKCSAKHQEIDFKPDKK